MRTIKLQIIMVILMVFIQNCFGVQVVQNSSFETVSDGNWKIVNNSVGWWNLQNASQANSGSRYQYLGRKSDGVTPAHNVDAVLYQDIQIPTGTTSSDFSFYFRISSQEVGNTAYDTLKVELRNTSNQVLKTFATYSNVDKSGSWDKKTFSFTGYAGETVRIAFRGQTDNATETVFRLDDVTLDSSVATSSGTIELKVNNSGGNALSVSEINSVILFDSSKTQKKDISPPTDNPVEFKNVKYGEYYFLVFCWDMLTSESGSFNHDQSTTKRTTQTNPKRPLNVTVMSPNGNTVLEGAKVELYSLNLQNNSWTRRASQTTGSTGKISFSVWPNITAGEKYQVRVLYEDVLVGSRDDFIVTTASAGQSIVINTAYASKPFAIIDSFAPVSLYTKAFFSAVHSRPASGKPITTYLWYFSDGGIASGASVNHTFTSGTEGYAIVSVSDGANSSTASVRFPLRGVGNPSQTGSASSLDPVNTATGNFVMNPTLLSVSARGLPFVFQAFYNSKAFDPMEPNPQAGPLGFGWTHNFEISASAPQTENDIQNVIIAFGDGHREKYKLIDNVWTPEVGIYNKLTRSNDGAFALTSPNQIKSQFDTTGKLVSIIDRNGNTLTVVWEVSGSGASRIARVQLPGGPDTNGNYRSILFSYDATSGHLQKLTDPISRTVEFTVDANHDLRGIKNPRGYSTTYTYDNLHQLLTGTDARNHMFVENEYEDRVVKKQFDVDRKITTFDYPFTQGATINFTRITRLATPDNEITEDYHNDKLQLVDRIVRIKDPANPSATIPLSNKFGYDPVTGDRISATDRNEKTTSYEYINGNIKKITTPDTSVVEIGYDAFNNPLLKTSNGIQAKWEYDEKGNLKAYTFPYDSNAPNLYKRIYTPDDYGQTTSIADANGKTTHAYYNEWGGKWKEKDAEGNEKIFTLDGIDRVTGVTGGRGGYKTFDLNENGGIETTTLWSNPGSPSYIKQDFDENDNRTKIEDQLHRFSYFDFDTQDRPNKVRNHLLHETVTRFDELGRAISIEDPKHHLSNMVYDLAGRVEEATDQENRKHTYTYDANGNILTDIDSDGVKMEYVYDVMNRRTKTRLYTSATEFDETETHYNLLGQIDWVEDGKDQRTYYYYNDAGQMNRMVDADQKEFTWTYDFEGNMLSASHPSATGIKTRYQTYTDRNQLKTRTDENGQVESFFYDALGNLDYTINADNQETDYVYDSLHRLDTINYPNGPPSVKFTYDDADQRQTMSDALGTTSWTYTLLGQIETVTDSYDQKLIFGYDENGNRDSITYPGNKTATYTYDDANVLESVTDWQTRTINRGYTAAGRVKTIALPNGVTTHVGYDLAGRENDIKHQRATVDPFIHLGYGFNKVGGIEQISPDVHPLARQFSAQSNAYTYDDANQLLTIDGTGVTHDKRGNILTGKLTPSSTGNDSLTWDYDSRLVAFTTGGVSGTNSYDGLGHRLQTTRGTATKRFVVDGTGSLAQVMAETDVSGNISAYYLYAGGLAARILTDGSISYYHLDRQGNTLALTDGSGSTTDLYQYDEFGVAAGTSGSTPNPFRYLGGFGVYDNGDGTLFARARHYNPALGRFLSRDPLFGNQQNGQSLNRYIYALNDPLVWSDPSGFSPNEGTLNNFYSSWWQSFGREMGEFGTGFAQGVTWSIDTKNLPDGSLVSRSIGISGGLVFSVAGELIAIVEKGSVKLVGKAVATESQTFRTWNEFQVGTAGQFSSRSAAATEWTAYKEINNIVSNVTRSSAAKSEFLKGMAEGGKAPSWMNQWLQQGKVPPGYNVDHIKPLSIGGADTPANMRLLDIEMHQTHHQFYHPWK